MRLQRLIASSVLYVAGIHMIGHVSVAQAQDERNRPMNVPVSAVLEVEADGSVTDAWIVAIGVWHDDDSLQNVLRDQHPLTDGEAGWASLILGRTSTWSQVTDSLQLPFGVTAPPKAVHIALGNVGGQDAFTFSDTTIGFDLRMLHALYGAASDEENGNRIDRFFAHEFTHLMHRSWRKAQEVVLTSALDRALWECLVEGLGNYRSLSGRWIDSDGALTPRALDVLGRLERVFTDRIAELEHATLSESEALMEGISSGAFDQKWGALTVALWLSQEAKGDDRRLRKWIDAGPQGVLALARKYLPEDLRARIPAPRD